MRSIRWACTAARPRLFTGSAAVEHSSQPRAASRERLLVAARASARAPSACRAPSLVSPALLAAGVGRRLRRGLRAARLGLRVRSGRVLARAEL